MFMMSGSKLQLNENDMSEIAQMVTDTVTTQMESDISSISSAAETINKVDDEVSELQQSFGECFVVTQYKNLVDLEAASWINDKLLNNVGWTEDREDYTTLNYPIPIEPGKTYSFNKNVNKIVIKSNNSIESWSGSGFIAYKSNIGNQFTVSETYTNAKYMFLSFYDANKDYDQFHDIKVEEGSVCHPEDKKISVKPEIEIHNVIKSSLYGKKMMTLGDSLTEGGFWQKYVSEALGLSEVVDLGIGGTKVNVFADNVTADNIADIDIVTVMGVFNSTSSEAGTVNDAASHDPDASICAGYKYIIDKILTLKPSVNIVLMSPHRPRANDVADKAAAVGEVAKYYGLPFIDLYNTAGFNDYTYDLYLRDVVHSSYGDNGGYAREAKAIAGGLIRYFG